MTASCPAGYTVSIDLKQTLCF